MKHLFKTLFSLSAIFLFYACNAPVSRNGELIDYVPENVSVVFKVPDFVNLKADLKNASFITEFGNTSPYKYFSEKAKLLDYLKPNSESLLCISAQKDGSTAFTFITKFSKTIFVSDSIKNKKIETLTFKNRTMQRVEIENETAFTATVDSIFIASSSQKILQEILEGKTEKSAPFQKIYSLPNSGGLTGILRCQPAIVDSIPINFASWAMAELNVLPNEFSGTGIVLAHDSIPQLLNVFEGQKPQKNHIANMIPTDAAGAVSITFSNWEKLQKKLKIFRGEKEEFTATGIFETINEVGVIELKNSKALILKSIDASMTTESLAQFISGSGSFRETELFAFNAPELFAENLWPFVSKNDWKVMFQMDDFFVFTENQTAAKHLISSYKNKATLANTVYFKDSKTRLSDASSLLILKMNGNFKSALSSFFDEKFADEIKNSSFDKYPLAALQFSYDRDFAHINFICKEASGAKQSSGSVSELLNIKLENQLLGNPVFFNNTASGGHDIVVQDMGNTLYYISESGKILWKKKLDHPILGSIKEVDIFKNGNKQMAFVTKNKFYIIDRNGKNTAPFPLKFKDEITQPLSVFDYENNDDYRFIITQGKEVWMYDNKGSAVKGFTFKKAKTEIVQPPQHFRMGKKDYIVIPEKNGNLNILSRTGNSRVDVDKTFEFSEIPIAVEDQTFVVITDENTKERITEDGKVSSQKLDVSENYWFEMMGNDKVTFTENQLRINGKLNELPIGIYGKPQINKVGRKLYVSIAETQEKKVYVFDENGALLPGFPVYGNSSAHISGAGNGKLDVLVKGDEKELIVYQIN